MCLFKYIFQTIMTKRATTLVSTSWLHRKLKTAVTDSLRILDTSWVPDKNVNSYIEIYQKAHIPYAVHFDLDRCVVSKPEIPRNIPDENCLTQYVQRLGIGNETHVVVYDSVNKAPSFRTWWIFRLFGHTNISVLDGGLSKWIADGYPVTTDEPTFEISNFKTSYDKELLFDFERMKNNLENKSHQIVDAREADKFRGSDGDGHNFTDKNSSNIPGSRNIPFSMLFNEDGTMRSEKDLKQLFKMAGIDINQPVVSSCRSGMTACGLAAALHVLGKDKTPVYYGSWLEWSRRFVDTDISSKGL